MAPLKFEHLRLIRRRAGMMMRQILTQCFEENLSTSKSAPAADCCDRQLILCVWPEVCKDDCLDLCCHRKHNPVT